jgi:hypothetical protein
MFKEKLMKSNSPIVFGQRAILAVLAVSVLSTAFLFSLPGLHQGSKAAAATQAQRGFATPDEAARALIEAAENYNVPALREILGPDGADLVSSGDPIADKKYGQEFAALAREKKFVSMDPSGTSRAILSVGNAEWPLPIPIVRREGTWYFDSKAGRQEILFRRIGANELNAIQICLGFVEAQLEYASTVHDDSGIRQYAQRLISTPGKQDGLYWENADGSPGGPITKGVAQAIHEGYSLERGSVFHGYYFRLLKGQGPAAPMGELDYVIKGMMIGGFALVAVPAEYRVTGVQTFIVSHDGIVYQKDLGPDSLNIVKKMERYNPDKTWSPVDDEWTTSELQPQ